MENMRIEEIETLSGMQTYVIIDREDGSQVSMLKSTWEELEAQKELGGTL